MSVAGSWAENCSSFSLSGVLRINKQCICRGHSCFGMSRDCLG